MQLHTADDQTMILAAFDYSLGRRTYMVSVCVGWLIAHWSQLGGPAQAYILRQTREALKWRRAGDKTDEEEWERLLRPGRTINTR